MQKRIFYGDQTEQFGELTLPESPATKKLPLVVSLHGGFWKDQYNLAGFKPLDDQLQAIGIATWNIEYRRVGSGGGYPETFRDVTAAINYVDVLAQEWPIDRDRILVVGHSAGGHLALWAASRYHHQADELGDPIQVKLAGVVSMAGVTDLKEMWADQQGTSRQEIVPNFIGGQPAALPAQYQLASPIEGLPLKTKTILVHGTKDDKVPFKLSQKYYQKAKGLGGSVELIELAGVGHFDLIDPNHSAWQRIVQVIKKLFAEKS